jgi:hypothetical protein
MDAFSESKITKTFLKLQTCTHVISFAICVMRREAEDSSCARKNLHETRSGNEESTEILGIVFLQ